MLFSLITMLVSCRNEQQENKTPLPEQIQIPKVTNYVFATIKTEEPVLIYSESRTVPSGISTANVTGYAETTYTTIPESANVKWIENMHISDIMEVQDFTEDDKYKLMDDFKSILDLEIDKTYKMQVNIKVRDNSNIEYLLQNKTTIKSRDVNIYTSYKEASEAKEMLTEIWKRSVDETLTGKPMNINYNN